MGHEFLRHVERARILIHVIDASTLDGVVPLERYRAINEELAKYKNLLGRRPVWVVLNKIDLVKEEEVKRLRETIEEDGYRVFALSAATTEGVRPFIQTLASEVFSLPLPELQEIEEKKIYRFEKKYDFQLVRTGGIVAVEGPFIRELMLSTNFSDTESFRHFQKRIIESGIQDALLDAGVEEGDEVYLDGSSFEFTL